MFSSAEKETVTVIELDGDTSASNKRKQSDLDQYVVTTSTSQKTDFDRLVAEFVFSVNLPFQAVDHPSFHALVSALRPGYKPPTSKSIGSNHLDAVYEKLQTRMRKALEGKDVTLQQDGCTNIKDDPIIATCISANGKAFFLDAKEPGAEKKTTDYIKALIVDSKETAEQKYGCKVRNIVTQFVKNV
jgi:hypothetical protein